MSIRDDGYGPRQRPPAVFEGGNGVEPVALQRCLECSWEAYLSATPEQCPRCSSSETIAAADADEERARARATTKKMKRPSSFWDRRRAAEEEG